MLFGFFYLVNIVCTVFSLGDKKKSFNACTVFNIINMYTVKLEFT